MSPDIATGSQAAHHLVPKVIELAREAGSRIAAEFARPGGPRGTGEKASVDAEVEAFLRAGLRRLLPAPVIGEELASDASTRASRIWVVDPHDGTAAFLEGHRGSAVSIALLEQGRPVLGVVYAPTSPDRGLDLIAWVEGMDHLLRNGEPVRHDLRQAKLAPGTIVFLSHDAARNWEANGRAVAPARFVALPSIAYRLARVACGDGVATLSVHGPCAWDYAAGHALLRAAHGLLLDEAGREVTYAEDGSSQVSRCFGGGAAAVRELLARSRSGRVGQGGARRPRRVHLAWPCAEEGSALDQAIGCLQGQLIGGSLGALVEFRSAGEIARAYPAGVRDLKDGGVWNTLAGQATDDSELALTLARSLLEQQSFDPDAVAAAYGRWYASRPFDIGGTTRQALSAAAAARGLEPAAAAMAAASPHSASNGSLMRVAPIGIAASDPDQAAAWAATDSELSHPHPQCVAACAAFVAAISAGIGGGAPRDMAQVAIETARRFDVLEVNTALESAAVGWPPADFQHQMGWVLIALQNAFRHLLHSPNPERALIETVGQGGDTDTNGAIAGALLGAAHGRGGWPARWTVPLLACRPAAALGAARPRPETYWPDGVPDLAEALLGVRLQARRSRGPSQPTGGAGPLVHPRRDSCGRLVLITEPTQPSPVACWHDPRATAVFVPDGDCPPALCGIACHTAKLPEDLALLEALCGRDAEDPPLPLLPADKWRSAGAVVLEPDGRVWVFEPTNHFGGTRATFPKGKVEVGDVPRLTAVREVLEETGLLVALGAYLLDAERTTSLVRYYLARRVSGTPVEMGWEAQSMWLVPLVRLAEAVPGPAEQDLVAAVQRHRWVRAP